MKTITESYRWLDSKTPRYTMMAISLISLIIALMGFIIDDHSTLFTIGVVFLFVGIVSFFIWIFLVLMSKVADEEDSAPER